MLVAGGDRLLFPSQQSLDIIFMPNEKQQYDRRDEEKQVFVRMSGRPNDIGCDQVTDRGQDRYERNTLPDEKHGDRNDR